MYHQLITLRRKLSILDASEDRVTLRQRTRTVSTFCDNRKTLALRDFLVYELDNTVLLLYSCIQMLAVPMARRFITLHSRWYSLFNNKIFGCTLDFRPERESRQQNYVVWIGIKLSHPTPPYLQRIVTLNVTEWISYTSNFGNFRLIWADTKFLHPAPPCLQQVRLMYLSGSSIWAIWSLPTRAASKIFDFNTKIDNTCLIDGMRAQTYLHASILSYSLSLQRLNWKLFVSSKKHTLKPNK